MFEPATEQEREAVERAASHYLGVAPTRVERISGHSARQVFRVSLPDRDVVLKVLHARKVRAVGCNFAVEGLTRAGVPTPQILAVDRSGRYGAGDFFEYSFLIQEVVPGEPLDRWVLEAKPSSEELAPILRRLGRLLRAIHSIEAAEGFGVVNDEGVGRYSTWYEHLSRSIVRQLSKRIVPVLSPDRLRDEGFISARQAAVIDELFRPDREVFRLSLPRLLHNDLTLKNVFIDSGRLEVTGIIDLHNAVAGDPALELARFRYFYRGRGYLDPLVEGYGDWGDDFRQRQSLYLVFVLLEKIAWLEGQEEKFPGRIERDLELLSKTLEELSL